MKTINTIKMNKLPWFLFAVITLGLFASCKKDLDDTVQTKEANFRGDDNCQLFQHFIIETATYTNEVDGDNSKLSELEVALFQPSIDKTEIDICLKNDGNHTMNIKYLKPENDLPDLDEMPKSNLPELTTSRIENGQIYSYDENNTLMSTDEAPTELFDEVLSALQATKLNIDEYVTARTEAGATVEYLQDDQISISHTNDLGMKIIELYDTNFKLLIGLSQSNSDNSERSISLFRYDTSVDAPRIKSIAQTSFHTSEYSETELTTKTFTKYSYL